MPVRVKKLLSAANIESSMGYVMLFGALASVAIVILGGALYLWQEGAGPVQYKVFHGAPPQLCSLHGIFQGARRFSGPAIIQMGLLFLVGVQLLRIVLTELLFFLGRDRTFVLITAGVLGMLIYGLFVR